MTGRSALAVADGSRSAELRLIDHFIPESLSLKTKTARCCKHRAVKYKGTIHENSSTTTTTTCNPDCDSQCATAKTARRDLGLATATTRAARSSTRTERNRPRVLGRANRHPGGSHPLDAVTVASEATKCRPRSSGNDVNRPSQRRAVA